ncbi:hypothetical protein CHELA40_50080 [Chelatococcus asaccharovorans]|nr:hypothetical protein CHELA17_20043 [Chelatococcus asaccharovorans]CAH1691091.1 hypothetical protein CHELA40_50080 [Chelatococcus asaccharovorans]
MAGPRCRGAGQRRGFRARFDLIASDRRSNPLYFKHNLIDPRFTPVGLCSMASPPADLPSLKN